MKRYICVKCGSNWFTVNHTEGSKCCSCQGELEEQQDLSNSPTDCSAIHNGESNASEAV
jgi:hypothetical protein